MTIMITLRQIRDRHPCKDGWKMILSYRGCRHNGYLDIPFPLVEVTYSNGLYDTLWAMRCLPEHESLWRRYIVWCARRVQHMTTDERVRTSLDMAERYANGEATEEELYSAANDACSVVMDTPEATTAPAVKCANWSAAWATDLNAGVAAEMAALYARDAVGAAWATKLTLSKVVTTRADWNAARAIAGAAETKAQNNELRRILTEN